MLLEENDLILIGLGMIIIGIVILVIPLLHIKKAEDYQVTIAFVYEIGDLIISSKMIIITGFLWIISGFILQIVAYI